MINDALELILAMKAENTKHHYRFVFDTFVNHCGVKPEKIEAKHALKFFADLKKARTRDGTPIAARTVKNYFSVLHSIYENLLILDFVKKNPIKIVKVALSMRQMQDKRPTAFVPFDKVKEVLGAPEPKTKRGVLDRAMLALLFGAGLRRSEALGLKVGEVKVSPEGVMFLELPKTKAGKSQVRVIAAFATPIVSALVSQRKADGASDSDPLLVFYYKDGRVRETLAPETLARRFKRYCKRVGVKASPHAARATFASKLKDLGFSDRETAESLGHATEGMVRVYDKRRRSVDDNPAFFLKY